MPRRLPHLLVVLGIALLALPLLGAAVRRERPAGAHAARDLGTHVLLAWNDLGMHCMNQYHADFSVLPPFNDLVAQVIRRGDATRPPELVTSGVTLSYAFPGNTTSVGKTDFWTYAPALFGVTLPPDVGLTGKGLTGTLDPMGTFFEAKGIPVTPFMDAAPTVEQPLQLATVVVTDGQGNELTRGTPVAPVSTEINCVSSGCHSSINSILNGHERVTGFDPAVRPILCAKCHASPALGTTGRSGAGYFSFRIHDQHSFMDQSMSGTTLCYKCHPGPKTQCLRGGMSTLHGQQCQNCHGNMRNVARTIENGRVPWVNEPRCGDCHAAAYAEQPNTLFRNSFGHGGVACEGCHNSTHADWPSRDAADNALVVGLQGYAGPLGDCTVCHGVNPAGAGPHGIAAQTAGAGLVTGAAPLRAWPSPAREGCSFAVDGRPGEAGRLILYDAQGRIVRMLDVTPGAAHTTVAWDGRDHRGVPVAAGSYFARWRQGERTAATRITVVH